MTSLIIGISGKAEHGKNTVAALIAELLPDRRVVRVALADALKREARDLFGWNGVKDETGRTLLQTHGVNRRSENLNYWISKAFDAMTDPDAVYVIPDVRFKNEADAIRARGGVVWRVTRSEPDGSSFVNHLGSDQKNHVSETELDEYRFDFFVSNTTLNDLRRNVRWAIGSCPIRWSIPDRTDGI